MRARVLHILNQDNPMSEERLQHIAPSFYIASPVSPSGSLTIWLHICQCVVCRGGRVGGGGRLSLLVPIIVGRCGRYWLGLQLRRIFALHVYEIVSAQGLRQRRDDRSVSLRIVVQLEQWSGHQFVVLGNGKEGCG